MPSVCNVLVTSWNEFSCFQLIRLWIRRVSVAFVYGKTMFAILFLLHFMLIQARKVLQLKASVCLVRNSIKLICLKMNLVEKWEADSFTKCGDVPSALKQRLSQSRAKYQRALVSFYLRHRHRQHIFVVTSHFHISIFTENVGVSLACARFCVFFCFNILVGFAVICLYGKCLLCTCKRMETFVCFPWILQTFPL